MDTRVQVTEMMVKGWDSTWPLRPTTIGGMGEGPSLAEARRSAAI